MEKTVDEVVRGIIQEEVIDVQNVDMIVLEYKHTFIILYGEFESIEMTTIKDGGSNESDFSIAYICGYSTYEYVNIYIGRQGVFKQYGAGETIVRSKSTPFKHCQNIDTTSNTNNDIDKLLKDIRDTFLVDRSGWMKLNARIDISGVDSSECIVRTVSDYIMMAWKAHITKPRRKFTNKKIKHRRTN